jgi:CRISPR-associated protein Cmr2
MPNGHFHFSIGPVQGFVSQARRTRDLWAGSYILSYLAGVAMKEIKDNGGVIVFPSIDNDHLFKALNNPTAISKDDPAARIGSLPNRFMAEAYDPAAAAKEAAKAVRDVWEKITEAAKKKFIETPPPAIDKIWKRQVENQWEISWVIGKEGSLLDQRKNLRTHFPAEEPGEKCTICGERQVLSEKGEMDSRKDIRDWWTNVADKFNQTTGYHFWRKEGRERLCAVCTTKRLLPLIKKGEGPFDWDFNHYYPSTAYMCVVDWLIYVLDKADKDDKKLQEQIQSFIKTANAAKVPRDETETKIKCVSSITDKHPEWKDIADFRGDVFFPDAIRNDVDFPLPDKNKKTDIIDVLKKLTDASKQSPTPFYALLLMDGDNMGKLLSEYKDKQKEISEALSEVTQKAQKIVEDEHNGKLIYAGGDDVLALLPLDTALPCAWALSKVYVKAFKDNIQEIVDKGKGTISAGIVYAHMNTPLQTVVRDAHDLLDDIAKKKLDRNAFAVRVWKRGGPILTFGKKWKEANINWAEEVDRIKEHCKPSGNGTAYTTGFIYRLEELIEIIKTIAPEENRIKLLTAEYLGSRGNLNLPPEADKKRDKAEERVKAFYKLSLYPDDEGKSVPQSDGPLFVRFLSDKEIQ